LNISINRPNNTKNVNTNMWKQQFEKMNSEKFNQAQND